MNNETQNRERELREQRLQQQLDVVIQLLIDSGGEPIDIELK